MYVLDTNTVIYFFKGTGRVGDRLLAVAPTEVALPAVVLYELEVGISLSRRPEQRRVQLGDLLDAIRVLPFADADARAAAGIRADLQPRGQRIGPLDILIAGSAIAYGGTLVTHNVGEFSRVAGLRIEDWF